MPLKEMLAAFHLLKHAPYQDENKCYKRNYLSKISWEKGDISVDFIASIVHTFYILPCILYFYPVILIFATLPTYITWNQNSFKIKYEICTEIKQQNVYETLS